MHALHTASLVLAWIIAIAWIGRLAEAVASFRSVPNLWDPEFDTMPEGSPRVTVIVPARNEAANISACIGSLLKQDYPNLRVIAVNDRSTDATGAALDQIAAGNRAGRLKVLHVKNLPIGWLGKTHAMALAARTAITADAADYLLFTDADIDFAPEAVRRALVAAVRTRADHFVALPTTIAKSRGEAAVLAFLQVIGMWAVRTWRVADPKAKRDAIGVGAFNMLRTEVYRQIGGFETLRMEVLEDLTLGRVVKQAGLRQRVAIAPGMVSVHWASGVLGIIRGMTKNFFAVFEYRIPLLLLATLAIATLCVGPVLLLAVPGARLPAVLAWGAASGMYAISRRVNQLSLWYAVLMPAAAAIGVYAMMRSALVTLCLGGVTWRGTFYSLKELRHHHSFRRTWAAGRSHDPLEETSDSIYDPLR